MKRITVVLGLLLLIAQNSFAESQSTNQVVGALPYSNQWEYEKPDSYLFLVYEPQAFSATNIVHGDYNISLASKASLYGINYFTKLNSLLPPAKKELALWLRLSLEFSTPSTGIAPEAGAPLSSASNSGQIFLGRVGAGPMLTWDLTSFLKPFMGTELWGYAYRHTAAINSADFTGQGLMLEPMLGVETRIIEPVHAMVQVGYNQSLLHSSSAIIGNSAEVSFGLGAMF